MIREPDTTWKAWLQHAEATPDRSAISHWEIGSDPYIWRWGSLLLAASSAARWLAARGVKKGDVCAVIIRHRREFYPLYMAVTAIGAIPAVLAYPNSRLHPDKFREGLAGMSQRSGLDYVLTEPDLLSLLAPLLGGVGSTIRQVLCPLEADQGALDDAGGLEDGAPGSGEDTCLVQHSSGTTGLQKPVALSHRSVLTHLQHYGRAIGLSTSDRVVSWLPLYHDMGLIAAFYLSTIRNVPLVQLSPMEWVAAPVILLDAISRERGTLCWLPNFAYNFMAERIREEDLAGIHLGSLRLLVNCSEPVRPDSHDKFFGRFSRYGLERRSLGASYAMAETVFAVTQTVPGVEAPQLAVDRAGLAQGRVQVVPMSAVGARVCASSGRTIQDCNIQIVDERRAALPPGMVGEIAIRSSCLFSGYRNYPDKTAEVLADDWYYSGDHGFLHGGDCYVVGRKKDVIIVAGNNIYPEDVEDAVGRVRGVLPGRVAAFGVDGGDRGTDILCVVAEVDPTADDDRQLIRTAVMQAAMRADISLSRVYLAPPRWMIKSSSGKPSRSANRDRALMELEWR